MRDKFTGCIVEKRGTCYVIFAENVKKFDDLMFLYFESVKVSSFEASNHSYDVYDYHRTGEFIFVKTSGYSLRDGYPIMRVIIPFEHVTDRDFRMLDRV